MQRGVLPRRIGPERLQSIIDTVSGRVHVEVPEQF